MPPKDMPPKDFVRKIAWYRRPEIALPAAAVAVALLGWSIFWFVATRKAESVLDAWVAREASTGRVWICPERKIGGFPFEIEVSCANPAFQGDVFGEQVSGTLKAFRAAAPLLRPESLMASLESPFTAKGGDGAVNLVLHWASLTLDIAGRPDAVTRISASGEDVKLEGTIGVEGVAATFSDLRIGALEAPDRHDGAYNIVLSSTAASVPQLAEKFGVQLPLAFLAEATATEVDFGAGGKFAQRMEGWRTKGGRVELRKLRLTSANARLDARGELNLDEEHRIAGRLDAGFSGLDSALASLGVNPAIVAAGGLLSSLLGKRAGDADDGTPKMPIPVGFSDGRLSIGPIRTPIRVPPLY